MARNRFLGSLFETKAAPRANPNAAVLRAVGTRSGMNMGIPLGVAGPWDMQKSVTDGLEKVAMVFRCVDAISQTQARIPMDIREMEPGKPRDMLKSVADEQTWKLLNYRANTYESSMAFRYRLSACLLLSRRGAFVEMVKDRTGRVTELHLLAPGSVEPIPHPTKFVEGYQIMRGDYVLETVEPERVAWIKIKPHPMDPYSQLTPLMAAGMAVETDWLARLFNRNYLLHDGRPGMLITIQGQMNPADAEEIKSRFNGGPAAAGRTSVIEADGIEVADLAANPRDVQWGELLSSSKQDIQLVFGVPESVMGNASGRTFDNADAERENYYVDTIQPHCEPIAFGLDPITGDIADNIVVAYDYSGIDVLQRMVMRRRMEYREEVGAGLRTIDSYLQETGQDTWDVAGTRVLYLPNGQAVARDDDDAQAVTEIPTVGMPSQADMNASQQGAYQGIQQGMNEAARQTNNTNSANAIRDRALRLVKQFGVQETKSDPKAPAAPAAERLLTAHPYLLTRTKAEGVLEGLLTHWDTRQESVVADRLHHAKFRKGTRHWESKDGTPVTDTKAVDPSYAVDSGQWADELLGSLGDTLRKTMLREARNAVKDLKSVGLPYPDDTAITDMVDARHAQVTEIVRTAAANQSARLQKTIAQMDAEGKSLTQIERKVRQMIGTRAPWRRQLSTNVVTTGVESVRADMYGTTGRRYVKTWNAELDERTRHTHVKADGQTRRAANPFRVGGFPMMFPGDPAAPIHEVANCRCWVDYQLSDQTARSLD